MHSATEAKTEYATSAVHSNAMHVTSASSNIGTPNQFMLMLYFHLHFYEEKKMVLFLSHLNILSTIKSSA